MHQLIRDHRFDEAKQRFALITNIDIKDRLGNTPIHVAAEMDEPELCEFLLKKGADTTISNTFGDTPLHCALRNGAKRSAAVLAKVNSDIYLCNMDEQTFVRAAFEKGEEWYPVFINSDTIGKVDVSGDTLLHYLVRNKFGPCVEYAVNNRMPLSLRNNEGKTPLELALETAEDAESVEMAVNLIEGGSELAGGKYEFFETAVKLRNIMYRSISGKTPLHYAAMYNQTGIAKYLIKESSVYGAKNVLQAKDTDGKTPLHDACSNGNYETADLLLKNGAFVDSVDSNGRTPLLMEIPPASQMQIYKLLVLKKASVRHKDNYGDTVLHIATKLNSSTDVIAYLVRCGATLSERNKDGNTPLAIAVANQNIRHIMFYADSGAPIHAQNQDGYSPLTLVLSMEHRQTKTGKVIELLSALINSKNIATTDSMGNNPVHLAILSNSTLPVIKYCVLAGPDINARNKDGDTALLIAAKMNNMNAGLFLLESGADMFITNTKDESPLKLAFLNPEIEKWILTKDRIEASDVMGNRPLHYAASWKMDDAVNKLVAKKVKVNAKNLSGETPLFSASRADSPSTIEILVKSGAAVNSKNPDSRDSIGNTPVHCAVLARTLNSIEKLSELGVDLNARNMTGKTALSLACQEQNAQVVSLLLKCGADVNSTDSTGRTVLTESLIVGNREIVSLFLSSGADPSIREVSGKNAFHFAVYSGDASVIDVIRKSGANPLSRDNMGESPFTYAVKTNPGLMDNVLGDDLSISDSDGNSPLHIAVENRCSMDIISELIKKGYSIDSVNSQGKTPLSIALEKQDEKLQLLLIYAGADFYKTASDGECALSHAFKKSNGEIISAIISSGSGRVDGRGDGILHYAARYAGQKTVQELVKKGLDVHARNVSGETPSDVAVRWHRPEIARILR